MIGSIKGQLEEARVEAEGVYNNARQMLIAAIAIAHRDRRRGRALDVAQHQPRA